MSDKVEKGFHWLSKAWYAKANLTRDTTDEVMIGDYCDDGGCGVGEFAIRWSMLGGENTPRLEMFEDSWKLLYEYSEFFHRLAHLANANPSPETIVDLLKSLGFEDKTNYTDPDEEKHKKEQSIKDAAPELYGALKEGLRIASDDDDEIFGGDLQARETAIVKWRIATRIALAKAEGKS